jgi:two-component system invasion response regulator UvrY
MIGVMLVDDHAVVRAGLRWIIDPAPDIEVRAEASNGEEALQLARNQLPDVVIMDLNMPGMGGLEATRRLVQRHPAIKVVALSAHVQEPYPSHLLDAGGVGFISKGCAPEDVLIAIRRVIQGQRYLSPDVASNLAATWAGPSVISPFAALSSRETEVMQRVMHGHDIRQIGIDLHISPKTVSTYRQRFFEKLGVRNDVELMRLAVRWGLVRNLDVHD